MLENPYRRWMSEDNDKCLPVMDYASICRILLDVSGRVRKRLGDGPMPVSTGLDFEQIQVADYASFEGVGELQASAIREFHKYSPVRADEMLLLGLRSLFQFAWPKPASEDDVRYAAAFDFVLNQVLTRRASELSNQLSDMGSLLPYWGRLSFLRVMGNLPSENVAQYGLNRVAVALVKKSKFNATTWALDSGPVITMNYALEPILKQLNRYILHFHCTKEMAGPKRLWRAWHGIAPIVLHFWSDVIATKMIFPSAILYGEDMVMLMHQLTRSQLDFIVGHELGHVTLDHPKRYQSAKKAVGDTTVLRQEFEYSADMFALGLMRSDLINQVKHHVGSDREVNADVVTNEDLKEKLHVHQRSLGAVYLLFVYMDFIQRAGEILRDKVSDKIRVAERMDTHPKASERLARLELMNMGEHLYTSPLQRFARDFFDAVLNYVSSMQADELLRSLD